MAPVQEQVFCIDIKDDATSQITVISGPERRSSWSSSWRSCLFPVANRPGWCRHCNRAHGHAVRHVEPGTIAHYSTIASRRCAPLHQPLSKPLAFGASSMTCWWSATRTGWLATALESPIAAFARGLVRDLDAVLAAIELPWSAGAGPPAGARDGLNYTKCAGEPRSGAFYSAIDT